MKNSPVPDSRVVSVCVSRQCGDALHCAAPALGVLEAGDELHAGAGPGPALGDEGDAALGRRSSLRVSRLLDYGPLSRKPLGTLARHFITGILLLVKRIVGNVLKRCIGRGAHKLCLAGNILE